MTVELKPMLLSQDRHTLNLMDWDGWVFQVKYDGMRAIVKVTEDSTTVISRSGRDVTFRFHECSQLHTEFPPGVYDGELYYTNPRTGLHELPVIQKRNSFGAGRSKKMSLALFDILELWGDDLTQKPLSTRISLLDDATNELHHIETHSHTDAEELFNATRERGLEGIVGKKLSSIYLPGVRTTEWMKFKH